jgi:hypothetical protein
MWQIKETLMLVFQMNVYVRGEIPPYERPLCTWCSARYTSVYHNSYVSNLLPEKHTEALGSYFIQ